MNMDDSDTSSDAGKEHNDLIVKMRAGLPVTKDDLRIHVAFQNKNHRSGLAVGERIPDFELRDQTGTLRRSGDLIGPNGMVLIFSRTADWCPYCRHHLMEGELGLDFLSEKGVSLCAITPDDTHIHKAFSDQNGVRYPILADSGSKVIEKFGIINANIPKDVLIQRYRMPFPGNYFVGPDGRIIDKSFLYNYENRQSVTVAVMKLFGVSRGVPNAELSVGETKIDISLSTKSCFPGQEVGFLCVIHAERGKRVSLSGGASPVIRLIGEAREHTEMLLSTSLAAGTRGEVCIIKGVFLLRWSAPPEFDRLNGLAYLRNQRLMPGVHQLEGSVDFELVDTDDQADNEEATDGNGSPDIRSATFRLPIEIVEDLPQPPSTIRQG